MSKPAVSVIVPVYNKAAFLRSCLDSLIRWGSKDYELILIDDGSSDGSDVICDEYAEKIPYMQVLHQKNSGVSHARNQGIKMAEGEWITFVDADDEVVPHTLNTVVSTLENSKDIDIIITSAVYAANENEPSVFEGMKEKTVPGSEVLSFLLSGGTDSGNIPAGATLFISGCKEKFYKKSFLDQKQISFDNCLSRNEDVLFSCMAYSAAKKIRFLPLTTYIMKDDPNGIVNSMQISKTVDNTRKFIERFKSSPLIKISDSGMLSVFVFHLSLIITGEAFMALNNKAVSYHEFISINNSWYNSSDVKDECYRIQTDRLSAPKKLALFFMKRRLYFLLGLEMFVHQKMKQKQINGR